MLPGAAEDRNSAEQPAPAPQASHGGPPPVPCGIPAFPSRCHFPLGKQEAGMILLKPANVRYPASSVPLRELVNKQTPPQTHRIPGTGPRDLCFEQLLQKTWACTRLAKGNSPELKGTFSPSPGARPPASWVYMACGHRRTSLSLSFLI